MKKRTIFSVLISLILLTCTIFSCTQPVLSGEKIKQWNAPQTYGGKDNCRTVSIELKDDDITWWCWTDKEGKILQDSAVKVYLEGSNTPITRGTKLEKGNTYEFKFSEGYAGKNTLYIHQPNRVEDDYKAGEFDCRGWIQVSDNNGVAIKDSGARQVVNKQVAVYFQNNEPVTGSGLGYGGSFFQNGDYTITEIWPLIPKTTGITGVNATYIVDEELKYTDLSIKSGDPIVGFLFPVKLNTDIIIAIYQPKRGAKGAEYIGENCKIDGEVVEFTQEILNDKKAEYFGINLTYAKLAAALNDKNREVEGVKISSEKTTSSIAEVCFKKTGDTFARTKSVSNVTIIDNLEPAYEGQK